MRRNQSSILLSLVLVLGACAKAETASECVYDSDCGATQICASGRCVAQCKADRDCPSGRTCSAGVCASTGCADSSQCEAGSVCNLGVCGALLPECSIDGNPGCAANFACSPTGRCVGACASQADCTAAATTCSNGACVSTAATAASLSGAAGYAGQAAGPGISVAVDGPGHARAVTGAAGAYGFAGLPPGLYTLTFTAPSSAEGVQIIQVAAKAGANAVPAVTFTPVGAIKGTARLAGLSGPAAQIGVFVQGTARGGGTDATGAYRVDSVPVGTQTLTASFPGYGPATASVTVKAGAPVEAPDLVLQPLQVFNGEVFAFVSTPPLTVQQGHAWNYTAVAGGAGITAVTYSLAAGPPGLVLSDAGVASFTPATPGAFTVAIAAAGGGAVIYQVFSLQVLPTVQALLPTPGPVKDADTNGGATWVVQAGALHRLAPGRTSIDTATPQRQARASAVTPSTSVPITGLTYDGGKVTSISGPIGLLGATWPGGKVPAAGLAIAGGVPLDSAALEGGTISAAKIPGADTALSISYPGGTAASLAPTARLIPTAVAIASPGDTGLVTSVDRLHLTDAQQSWTPAQTTGRCLSLASPYSSYFNITSATATTITVSDNGYDLSTFIHPGDRYFLTTCYGNPTWRVTTPGDFTAAANLRFDAYVNGALVGTYPIVSGAIGSFVFTAPTAAFPALQQLVSAGFLTMESSSGYTLVTLTDPAASFATLTPAPRTALLLAGYSPYGQTFFGIDSLTPTTLTLRVPLGTDLTALAARRAYGLGDANGVVPTSVQLAAGGLVPSALKGQSLWNDATGSSFPILDNGPSAIMLSLTGTALAGQWTSVLVAPTSPNKLPPVVVTDAKGGLAPGHYAGRRLLRRTSGGLIDRGLVSANDATTLTVVDDGCSYSTCPGRLASALTELPRSTWLANDGNYYNLALRVTLNASGSPGWVPGALVGRQVASQTNLALVATILQNQASQLSVSVSDLGAADAFAALGAGQQVYLTDYASGRQETLAVTLTPEPAPGWSPGAWTGQSLIGRDGALSGTITGNTATSLSFNATPSALAALPPGAAFTFGGPSATCNGGQFSATITLAGATLAPGGYDALQLQNQNGFPVPLRIVSSDGSGSVVTGCGSDFGALQAALGTRVSLSRGGVTQLTLTDAAATYQPGAFAGGAVRALSVYTTQGIPVTDNGAQTLSLALSAGQLSLLSPLGNGAGYVVSDAQGLSGVRLTTSAALPPGKLVGRFVASSYQSGGITLPVFANDAGSVTTRLLPQEVSGLLQQPVATLQLSAGAAFTITDGAAAFTPGALIGQTVQVAGRLATVVSNTVHGLVAATSDSTTLGALPTGAATYTMANPLALVAHVTALPDGSALASGSGAAALIARVGGPGPASLLTPLTTGTPLQVTPRAAQLGTFTSLSTSGSFLTLTDTAAAWTPGALAGALVWIRTSGYWYAFNVIDNGASTLRLYNLYSFTFSDGSKTYLLDPMRLDVSGGGLTPHAAAGTPLWVQGATWLVRDNDASSLLLTAQASSFSGQLAPADLNGAPAWLLTGLRGRKVNGVAALGAGFVAATDDGLSRFDGVAWTHLGSRETSAQLASGAVDDFTSSSVTCNACSFTPAALAGAQLVMGGASYTIQGNTDHLITLSYPSVDQSRTPLPHDPFVVLDGRGLAAEATTIATDGTTTWVTSTLGLHKGTGAGWSLLTPSTTQSAPGKADGLAQGIQTSVALRPNGEVWVSSAAAGVARLQAGAWKQFTAASTESAFAAGDGLPGDSSVRVTFDGARVWFAGKGAASYDGASWTSVPFSQLGNTSVVAVPAPGVAWFGTAAGLFVLNP
jgi:hypothetical protein